jgi:DNA-binding SARP family transcriptional activator/nucleoid-associated protein YgaU
MSTVQHGVARRLRAALAATVLAGMLAGIPSGLVLLVGWPLPTSLPTLEQVQLWATTPLSDQTVINTLAILLWYLWAQFTRAVAVETLAARSGAAPRRLRGTAGTQRLAAVLVTAISMTTTTTAAVAGPALVGLASIEPAPTAHAAPAVASTAYAVRADMVLPGAAGLPTAERATVPAGRITLSVDGHRWEHTVAEGDTLWDVAGRWLDDPTRWPEIYALNRGRYWPEVSGTTGLRDPDLIHPGWVLELPADATPPPDAEQADPPPEDGPDAEAVPELVHEVANGDWMWHIADRYLGDPHRYPEIAALNPTYEQRYPGFPDHIEPGDELVLPPDAHDSGPIRHASGDVVPVDEPPAPQPPPPEPEPAEPPDPPATGSPQPSPPAPVTPADPDGVVPNPAATPTPTTLGQTATTGEPATSPTPPADPSPSPGPAAAGEETDDQPAAEDGDGVVLGDGSWIPWAVAAAVAAAMAVVWLQRRRRYHPRRLDHPDGDTDELHLKDPDPAALDEPATVSRIRRALRIRFRGEIPPTAFEPEPEGESEPGPGPGPEPASESGSGLDAAQPVPSAGVGQDEQPPPLLRVPAVEPLPEGGTGIVGPGAEAAARGALVAALSAGAPVDPDAQTEVVVPAEVMVTLLGADAVTLGTWRRLRVTPDLDSALAVVEARLLSTARLLDEYELEDLAALRAVAPAERPVPPMLLISDTPGAEARMRTRNALGLGTGLGVSALLLGSWDHGPTIHVEIDGSCRPATGGAELPPGIPTRMPVADQQTAFELLTTLREAHTGQASPPAAASTTPNPPATEPPDTAGHGDAPVHDEKKTPSGRDDAQRPVPEPAEPAPSAGGEEAGQEEPAVGVPTASVRVLGMPEIEGWQKAGRPLRKAAVELLTYLAVHPDGAAPDQIQEDLWPDSRRRLAATKLHTAASNLRHLLAAGAGADDEHAGAYVRKEKGRYRIPAGPVEIDLWTLRAEAARARRTADPAVRVAALREACQAYRGELAAGRDYEWVTGHREAARQLALDAHTTLASLVADDDPDEAARLLLAAVAVDPMAEAVYRQAMHACHRIGDAETIRSLLRRLAGQLEVVGGEPADETIELAEKLRTELNQPPGPARDTTGYRSGDSATSVTEAPPVDRTP